MNTSFFVFSARVVLTSVVLACITSAALPASAIQPDLSNWVLEPMPSWYQERFSRGHLNIDAVMQTGLTRLQAVEIQNQMKDLLSKNKTYMGWEQKGTAQEAFRRRDKIVMQALKKAYHRVVKEGFHESGFYPQKQAKKMGPDAFYVAFDLDETLLNQWYQAGEQGFHDVTGAVPDFIFRPYIQGPSYVSMTPGWEESLTDLLAHPQCAGVLVFTAKADTAAQSIIDKLTLKGRPLRSVLKGVFTRHHLVRSSANVKLSKDLRIIDESLKHVVLVDDNPTRILPRQYKNLRAFAKYNADSYYKNTAAKPLIDSYLPQMTREIVESATYAGKHNLSFASAYYPYSYKAATPMATLLTQGYTIEKARHFLRGPQQRIFSPAFYIPANAGAPALH